ncbi:unnamed protein product [Caenorhabditis bovis]|uniref:Uncharacterized protein n=1 Tax=Caenorhabditis bovis TaxID=2654633 RepID=A0A8S1F5Q5_9PELO|nr:unnamed protein product [Caenorhabditis bovis]
MVMSSLPKCTLNCGGTISRRKIKCGKNDNFLMINYMYVGTPKRKMVCYVRERRVYRNVEITFEEFLDYLIDVCDDSSISLHYTIVDQYLPISTTGQLHTFFQHVHNDSNMMLYVENKDYVWNVQQKDAFKKKKRPTCPNANRPVDAEGNACNCEECTNALYGSDSECEDEDSLEDEESDEDEELDEEDEEEEEQESQASSENRASSPIRVAKKMPNNGSNGSASLNAEENDSDEQVVVGQTAPPATPPREKFDYKDRNALRKYVKKILESYDFASMNEASLEPDCIDIAEKLIKFCAPTGSRLEKATLKKCRKVLKFTVGAKIVSYFHDIFAKGVDKDVAFDTMFNEAIEEVSNSIEVQRHFTNLGDALFSLEQINADCAAIGYDPVRVPHRAIHQSLINALRAFRYVRQNFYNAVSFRDCDCKQELDVFEKTLEVNETRLRGDSLDYGNETKNMFWESTCKIIKSSIDRILQKLCERHSLMDAVFISDSESNTESGDQNCVSETSDEEMLVEGEPEADRGEIEPISSGIAENSTEASTQTTTGKKTPSPELMRLIEEMMKSIPPPHKLVYPPMPKPGAIMIPTGGLARCRCSKDCIHTLNEPAYEYMERFNEPRQAITLATTRNTVRKGIYSFVIFEVTAFFAAFAAFRVLRRSEEKRKYLYLNWPKLASSYYWIEDTISFGQLTGTRLRLNDQRRWAHVDVDNSIESD